MIYYDRPCVDDNGDIDTFCQSVWATLQYWLDIHTNPKAWAVEWAMLDEYDNMQDACTQFPILQNDYFNYDWAQAALDSYAEEYAGNWMRCPECGEVDESSVYCDCDCTPEEMEPKDLAEYLQNVYGFPDVINVIPEHILERTLLAGHNVYYDGIGGLVADRVDEVQEFIRDYDNATTNQECLTAALWGLHIAHVFGNIVLDYGCEIGADTEMMEEVQNGSLEDWFDEEEIAEFLAQED